MKQKNIILWEESKHFYGRARSVGIVYERTDWNMGKRWKFFHTPNEFKPTI